MLSSSKLWVPDDGPDLGICIPRWGTPRTPDRPTLGHEAAKIAELLGEPLMPWQRYVLDVGLELVPNDRGGYRLAYREIIVTIPRQSGKTQLWLTLACHRSTPFPNSLRPWSGIQRSAFTMQSGWDAHKKLVNDHGPKVIHSQLGAALDKSRAKDGMTRGVGNAALLFLGGSRIDVVSSSETAGHGLTLDLGGIDEAFADPDDRREQALLPTMATRVSPQLLITSTAGTDASVYLLRKVDVGRSAVENGAREGVAYFEWSAPRDGEEFPDGHVAQFDDPETWRRCMPALGHTIDVAVIEHALQSSMKPNGDAPGFRRAYLNQWTQSAERVISQKAWTAIESPSAAPSAPLTFAVDIHPDRTMAAIGVADGDGQVELLDDEFRGEAVDQDSALANRLIDLCRRHDGRMALDVAGPAGSLLSDLQNAGVEVVEMRSAHVTQACGAFYDAVADHRIAVRPNERLTSALSAAGKHPVGDAWRWGRRVQAGDVTPLVAITLAFWAAKQPRDEEPVAGVVSLDDLEDV